MLNQPETMSLAPHSVLLYRYFIRDSIAPHWICVRDATDPATGLLHDSSLPQSATKRCCFENPDARISVQTKQRWYNQDGTCSEAHVCRFIGGNWTKEKRLVHNV